MVQRKPPPHHPNKLKAMATFHGKAGIQVVPFIAPHNPQVLTGAANFAGAGNLQWHAINNLQGTADFAGAGSLLASPLGSGIGWHPSAPGAGGFVTNLSFDNTSTTRLAMTDTGNAYIWNSNTNQWDVVLCPARGFGLNFVANFNRPIAYDLQVAPQNPNKIYCMFESTTSGFFYSHDGCQSFIQNTSATYGLGYQAGPNISLPQGQADPQNATGDVYGVITQNGFFYTLDSGVTMTLNPSIPNNIFSMRCMVAVDKTSPTTTNSGITVSSIWYVTSGDSTGNIDGTKLYKSTTGPAGVFTQITGGPTGQCMGRLKVHPTTGDLYVGMNQAFGPISWQFWKLPAGGGSGSWVNIHPEVDGGFGGGFWTCTTGGSGGQTLIVAVGSYAQNSPLRIGSRVTGGDGVNGITASITGLGTGSGGAGTYTLSTGASNNLRSTTITDTTTSSTATGSASGTTLSINTTTGFHVGDTVTANDGVNTLSATIVSGPSGTGPFTYTLSNGCTNFLASCTLATGDGENYISINFDPTNANNYWLPANINGNYRYWNGSSYLPISGFAMFLFGLGTRWNNGDTSWFDSTLISMSYGTDLIDPADNTKVWRAWGLGVCEGTIATGNSSAAGSAYYRVNTGFNDPSAYWTSKSLGIENIDACGICCPPGGRAPLLGGQDVAIARITSTNPNGPTNAQVAWTNLGLSQPSSINYASNNPDVIVSIMGGNQGGLPAYSSNAGLNWTQFGDLGPWDVTTGRWGCITASDANNMLWFPGGGGGNGLPFYTTNGGTPTFSGTGSTTGTALTIASTVSGSLSIGSSVFGTDGSNNTLRSVIISGSAPNWTVLHGALDNNGNPANLAAGTTIGGGGWHAMDFTSFGVPANTGRGFANGGGFTRFSYAVTPDYVNIGTFWAYNYGTNSNTLGPLTDGSGVYKIVFPGGSTPPTITQVSQQWLFQPNTPTGGGPPRNAAEPAILKAVPTMTGSVSTPGHLFYSGGISEDRPIDGWGNTEKIFGFSIGGMANSWIPVLDQSGNNVIQVTGFDFGACAPGHTYPSIYINGWVNNIPGGTYGIFVCPDFNTSTGKGTWTQIGPYPFFQSNSPLGSISLQTCDTVLAIGADKVTYPKCFVGHAGTGWYVYQ